MMQPLLSGDYYPKGQGPSSPPAAGQQWGESELVRGTAGTRAWHAGPGCGAVEGPRRAGSAAPAPTPPAVPFWSGDWGDAGPPVGCLVPG